MAIDHSAEAGSQAQLRDRAAHVLEIGFRVAVAIMAIGLVFAVTKQEALPSTLGQPADVVRGVVNGDPGSIVGVGIIAIILTPFVSTFVIALTFYQQGNRRYAMISAFVLLILLISIGLSLI